MKAGSEVFLDTNILVYSTLKDFDPEKHVACRRAIDFLCENNLSINISIQVLREFYAVVTGKRYLKNPLSPTEAKDQILFFKSVFNVLEITQEVLSELLGLVDEHKIIGQKIHDTTIVATMFSNDIQYLITYNQSDFSSFKEIEVIPPEECN